MVFIALNIKRGLERVFNYKDFPSGFLISYFTICACCAVLSCSVISDSLWPHGLQPTRLLCPWGFSRQKYWSGLPWLPPGDLPNQGATQVSHITGGFFTIGASREAHHDCSPRWALKKLRKERIPASSLWQTAASSHGELWGNSGSENTGHWLQISKVHIKGMISMSPDSCTFKCTEKC